MRLPLFGICLAAVACATVRADSVFPLAQSLAAGRTLPPAYGIGVSYYTQEQDYRIENLTFNLPGFALPGTLHSENSSDSWLVQPRLWVLPFLQVYGAFGRVENETKVTQIPLPGADSIVVKSDGQITGGGFFLGSGWGKWFAGVSATWTQTDLDVAASSIRTFNLSPRAGRAFSWGTIWLGGNFLDSTEKSSGVFQLPPGFPLPVSSVAYSAEFTPSSHWNAAAGVRYDFNRHVGLTLEAGFIKRTSLHLGVELAW